MGCLMHYNRQRIIYAVFSAEERKEVCCAHCAVLQGESVLVHQLCTTHVVQWIGVSSPLQFLLFRWQQQSEWKILSSALISV